MRLLPHRLHLPARRLLMGVALLCGLLVLGAARDATLFTAHAHTIRGRGAATIVALGDSITYGWPYQGRRRDPWTAVLARRLHERIVNAGIPGNAVGILRCRSCGAPAVKRLWRDALSVRGIRTLIVMEGINDALHGGSAHEIIHGLRWIARQAHAHGVRVIAGTLLPCGSYRRHTVAAERIREAVNHWIRTTRVFDGVVDFARVMRDPRDPLRLNPAYDSGDGLHPNLRGYRVMGDAVPLALLRPAPLAP